MPTWVPWLLKGVGGVAEGVGHTLGGVAQGVGTAAGAIGGALINAANSTPAASQETENQLMSDEEIDTLIKQAIDEAMTPGPDYGSGDIEDDEPVEYDMEEVISDETLKDLQYLDLGDLDDDGLKEMFAFVREQRPDVSTEEALHIMRQILEDVDPRDVGAQAILNGGPKSELEAMAIIGGLNNVPAPGSIKDPAAFTKYMLDDYRDTLIDRYRKSIDPNKHWNYKEGVPGVDSSKTYEGATAQELEKINPAVVNDGEVKTVDTGQLSTQNASAIAQLAQEVEELKNKRWSK